MERQKKSDEKNQTAQRLKYQIKCLVEYQLL